MGKAKYIILSLVGGIVTAIILFGFFAFGAMLGSHLRFFGYVRHKNRSDTITGEIIYVSKKTLAIDTPARNILHIHLFKDTTVKEFSIKGREKKLSISSLKKGEFIYIIKFKDKTYITVL